MAADTWAVAALVEGRHMGDKVAPEHQPAVDTLVLGIAVEDILVDLVVVEGIPVVLEVAAEDILAVVDIPRVHQQQEQGDLEQS